MLNVTAPSQRKKLLAGLMTAAVFLSACSGSTSAATADETKTTTTEAADAKENDSASTDQKESKEPTTDSDQGNDPSISANLPVDEVVFTDLSGVEFGEALEGVEMGPVYGDPTKTAHGSLMRFAPGTVVPDHFYSYALRGVVIEGEVKNESLGEDKQATTQSAGGYFSWPAEEDHITSCVSDEPCLFFIFQDGPFELTFNE